MEDNVVSQLLSSELPEFPKQNLTDFIYNEMNQQMDDGKKELNVELKKNDLLEKIEYFNNNYKEFHEQERMQKFILMRDLRHMILTKNMPPFKFWKQNSILDDFISLLVKTHQSKDILFNIEIQRIFNRLSQTYIEFLNPFNINEYNQLMAIRTSKEEHPLVRHYALVSLGKIIRQSKKWAEELLCNFPFVFDGIQEDLNAKEYFDQLEQEFNRILIEAFGGDNFQKKLFEINRKLGDPYIYALRGFTLMLADTDRLQNHLKDIVIMVLKYFETARKNGTINLFSGSEKIEILNDIIAANFQGTFQILYECEFMVKHFFNGMIPYCERPEFSFFSLLNPIMILISSFFNNGEKYAQFFDDDIFSFDFILRALIMINDVNLKTPLSAAECMFAILNLRKEEAMNLFFNGDKYHYFIDIIDIAKNENMPYVIKNAFYHLVGKFFQHYIWDKLEFDVNAFIQSALDGIDQCDYNLALNALYALNNLYWRMKLMGVSQEFAQCFIESGGKDSIERIIEEEEGVLYEAAASFMSDFDGFNK